MARVKMTKTARFALIFLRIYLIGMLALILAKFLQVFK
jgi:hypothetical protein